MFKTVTAEVAGSSPVVPAIHSKRLRSVWRNPEGHKKDTVLRPFCVPNAVSKTGLWNPSRVRSAIHLESGLEANTNDMTAA